MKNILLLTLCFIVIRSTTSAQAPEVPQQPHGRVVTAAQINGLYRYDRNDFRILALGRNKLKVQFNGEWMTRGGYPNIGEALGEADIVGNVATFIPGDTTKSKITLTFLTNRMKVTQEGLDAECGFGHNVVASGTYRRVKSGRPRFIPTL
ncbi:MAG: hypothetical protein QOK48_3605 [Blastocatellia bacterium]|jgi:hypothetical protein|nr:hypothetical protein [Blastocatellia bacterium]